MIPAIELDHEPGARVVQVGAAHESPFRVVQVCLDRRFGESRGQKQPPQASLHRRFSRPCNLYQAPKPRRSR